MKTIMHVKTGDLHVGDIVAMESENEKDGERFLAYNTMTVTRISGNEIEFMRPHIHIYPDSVPADNDWLSQTLFTGNGYGTHIGVEVFTAYRDSQHILYSIFDSDWLDNENKKKESKHRLMHQLEYFK